MQHQKISLIKETKNTLIKSTQLNSIKPRLTGQMYKQHRQDKSHTGTSDR
jgi:hypothetical protein